MKLQEQKLLTYFQGILEFEKIIKQYFLIINNNAYILFRKRENWNNCWN